MNYSELSEQNKEIVKKQLEQHVKDIDYNLVDASVQEDKLILKYKGMTLSIPIQKPDKATSNHIWTMLTSGVLIIAGVAVALLCANKKNDDSSD